jgi:HAD superfamily hydrolase (TIGR01549 family)
MIRSELAVRTSSLGNSKLSGSGQPHARSAWTETLSMTARLGEGEWVISAVFFDVGETIVDESREYGTWADWLGVPRHTFSAVFGAVIARGGDYRDTFQVFRPGFDLSEERERRAAVGKPETFAEENLYPDARPCLQALRDLGLLVGLAGNQTARAELILKALDLPVDIIGTSDGWGVAKPDREFFDRVVVEGGGDPATILYVGDRLDNDIRPAQKVGLATCLIRRGPWGHILDMPDAAGRCLFRIDSLAELPGLVAAHNAAGG